MLHMFNEDILLVDSKVVDERQRRYIDDGKLDEEKEILNKFRNVVVLIYVDRLHSLASTP